MMISKHSNYKSTHHYGIKSLQKISKTFKKLNTLYIISLNTTYISLNEVEAMRKIIKRTFLKGNQLIIRIQTYFTTNKKSLNARCGRGVSKKKFNCIFIKKGSILFEIIIKSNNTI